MNAVTYLLSAMLFFGMATIAVQASDAKQNNSQYDKHSQSEAIADIKLNFGDSNILYSNDLAASPPVEATAPPEDLLTLHLSKNCKGEPQTPLQIPLTDLEAEDDTARAIARRRLQQLLFANKIDINGTNDFGETLLLQACKLNSPLAVALLCSCAGINPNKTDNVGNTPMTTACQHGTTTSQEILSQLLLRYADINGTVVTHFVDGSSHVAWPHDTPLSIMVKAGHVEHVTWLIERKAQLGKDNLDCLEHLLLYYPLHEAIKAKLIATFGKKRWCGLCC